MSHRCSESQSLARCSLGAQLLWHRLVHDEGMDEWGLCQGQPRMVHASCLAGTTDFSAEDTEGFIAELVAEGMLRPYEVNGKPFLATVNHEAYAWRSRRPVPTIPMTQEIVDTRNFSTIRYDTNRKNEVAANEAALESYCERCQITVEWRGRTFDGRLHRAYGDCGNHAVTAPQPQGSRTATDGNPRAAARGVRCGEEGCGVVRGGAAPQPHDELPTPNRLPGTVNLDKQHCEFVQAVAGRHPRSVWVDAVKAWPATVTPEVFREETGCDSPEHWLLALAVAVEAEDKPQFRHRSFRDRANERGCPSAEARAKAAQMLGGEVSETQECPVRATRRVVGLADAWGLFGDHNDENGEAKAVQQGNGGEAA